MAEGWLDIEGGSVLRVGAFVLHVGRNPDGTWSYTLPDAVPQGQLLTMAAAKARAEVRLHEMCREAIRMLEEPPTPMLPTCASS